MHGIILFPLPPSFINVIRDIKFKTTYWAYEKIVEVIEHEIQQIETHYLPESKLPDKPDWGWIENLILEIYEENKWQER